MKKLIYILLIFIFFSACSEYNKALKTDDLKWKYEVAIELYNNEEYSKAYPLIEDLIIIYRGTAKAEVLSYYLSNCDYYLKDYMLASFRYKNFANTFPLSQYTEECEFKSAYCQFLQSPKYSLDQSSTYSAITGLQLFINRYPNSTYVDSCNSLIDQLRVKLEKKNYENANQYFRTKNYKAAIVSFENLLNDYPGGSFQEEATFMILKSSYFLTINSVQSKKMERIDDSINSYIKFVDSFPNSKFINEAEELYESLLKEKEKEQENKKS